MKTVFRFTIKDAYTDERVTSPRWATAEYIASVGGEVIGEGVEVDDEQMDCTVPGMRLPDPSPFPMPTREIPDMYGRYRNQYRDTSGNWHFKVGGNR